MMQLRYLLVISIILLITGCTDLEEIYKTSVSDPFESTLAESQFFTISGTQDNIFEGNKGTILVLPKGCFLNAKGHEVTRNIELELSEVLTLDDMVLSNLTTTSQGKLLETDGMIFVNATSKGKQLKINPDNPIYIEIPTKKIKPGMMVYDGIRDENGNMDWINPKPLENSLIPIDIFSLDFLPMGFKEEVEVGLPFGNFQKPTVSAVDSLYYYLEVYRHDLSQRFNTIESFSLINEPYYENALTSEQIIASNLEKEAGFEMENEEIDTLITDFGVNPLKIKAIKTDAFQNTLIATREFEKRLQTIFKVCRPDIIDIYINNLDKNMWELDSIAAEVLKGDFFEDDFLAFKNERKTKVKGASKNVTLLKSYYKQRLLEVEADRQRIFDVLEKVRVEEKEKLDKLKKQYQKILNKREKHRMETYGFTQTSLGWVNIDKGTIEKDWGSQKLELVVENGATYDKLFTYVFYKSINSLYRLNTTDNITFFVGNSTSREMLIPKDKPAIMVGVGYLDDKRYLGVLEFYTSNKEQLNIDLKEISKRELKRALQKFEINGEENSIATDLEYVKKLTVSKKEKRNLLSALEFFRKLERKTYPSVKSVMRYNKWYGIDLPVYYCDPVQEVMVEEVPEEIPIN